jgi:hypothetical protein
MGYTTIERQAFRDSAHHQKEGVQSSNFDHLPFSTSLYLFITYSTSIQDI